MRQVSPADYRRLFGEFRHASEFVRRYYDRPIDFWRTLTLNYRPAWVVNNVVGQTLLYALNHAGHGAGKAYAQAILGEAGRGDRYFPEELRQGFFKTESGTRSSTPARVGRIEPLNPAKLRTLGQALRLVRNAEQAFRERINDVNASLSDNVPRRAAWYRVVADNRDFLNRQVGAHHTFDELLGELRKAAEDPARGDKRLRELHDQMVKQVHDQLIDFNNLTEAERRIVRRIVPFYSWIKGITKALALFTYEHPLKAAVLTAGARVSNDQLERIAGKGAKVLEGLLPLGKGADRGHGPEQDVLSTRGLNPYNTVADVLGKLTGSVSSKTESPFDNPILLAGPVIQTAQEAITRREAFSGKPLEAPLGILGRGAAESFPQVQLAEKLLSPRDATNSRDEPHLSVPGADFHGMPYEALGYLGLPVQRKNLGAAKAIAERQDSTPAQRAYRSVFKRRTAFYAEMKRLNQLDDGKMPAKLKQAFNVEAERQGMYAHGVDAAGAKPGTPAYHLARFGADTHLLMAHHQVDEAEASKMLAWAERHRNDLDKLKDARRYISETYYQAENAPLWLINESKKYLEEKGAKGLR